MRFGSLLHGGPPDTEDISRIRATVLFEEPGLQQRVVRFAALLVLASAISTFGLISDSVAAVIGAMIVAPLMLPIMGLAFGIGIGDRRAIVSSIVVSIGGIAAAIVVGLMLSLPFIVTLDPLTNAQIMSRTAPRLVDLCAALATGLAGAFAISRKDVSDTLPGVAIAISLVPPLTNAGILLGAQRPDLAIGSLLLFATNYLAIVLTGAITFAVMGFPSLAFSEKSARARRSAIIVVVALALAITVPLGAESYYVLQKSMVERRVASAAKTWLSGTRYRFVSVSSDPQLGVLIAGQGERPDVAGFQQLVKGRLYGQDVIVHVVPEEEVAVTTK
jgi:uncharacterized hydrophobic protein (TIGR00271 family)